ncbi:sulfurtransferase TusA family protein [Vulcanococcus limneticus]|uniref:sulfurtransferase TusA family protein n=1 Tax=Vulcanococcus limneticus TaxID=2170428 RepID=UPI001E492701|nr:sulfurtransferase TusA family protein [Vulcanococcus limneticus]
MTPPEPAPTPIPAVGLDLRGTPCPVNFIRARLALEKLEPGQWLQLDLDRGEPEQMVSEGLRGDGHQVECEPFDESAVRLLIRRHGG